MDERGEVQSESTDARSLKLLGVVGVESSDMESSCVYSCDTVVNTVRPPATAPHLTHHSRCGRGANKEGGHLVGPRAATCSHAAADTAVPTGKHDPRNVAVKVERGADEQWMTVLGFLSDSRLEKTRSMS